MTKRVAMLGAVCALVVGATGCLEDGGGAGVGISDFTRGFVFIRPGDRQVYAADEVIGLDQVAQLTTAGGNRHPSISSDGRSVVFVHQEGASTVLQTISIAGGAPATVLTSDAQKSRFANPVFSPDGRRIVFVYESSGSSYLGVVNADGTGFIELTSGASSYGSPSFFADGRSVLVAAGSLASRLDRLEKVNVDTGASQNLGQLPNSLALADRVVLSPDEARAVFDASNGSGGTRIFAFNLMGGGSQPAQLTDHPGDAFANDSFPTWVGSTEVAFSSDSGGGDQVYRLSASAVRASGTLVLPSALEPWYGPN